MKSLALFTVLVLVAGCATTLEHPITHTRVACQSGWAYGGGTGIAGAVLLGIALVGDVLFVSEYRKCVNDLKRAGYEEVQSVPNVPEPLPPQRRDSG